MAALPAGRLTRDDAALEDFAESMVFELRDMQDWTEHLEAIEQEAANDVASAASRLVQARNRHAAIKEQLGQLRSHLTTDRLAVLGFMRKAGFAHHVREECNVTADAALIALAARRTQA